MGGTCRAKFSRTTAKTLGLIPSNSTSSLADLVGFREHNCQFWVGSQPMSVENFSTHWCKIRVNHLPLPPGHSLPTIGVNRVLTQLPCRLAEVISPFKAINLFYCYRVVHVYRRNLLSGIYISQETDRQGRCESTYCSINKYFHCVCF